MAWLNDSEILCLLLFIVTCLLLLIGFPVAFSLAGSALIFAYIGYVFDVFDITFLNAFPQRVFSVMTNPILVAVPLFVFMGVMLERSKIAEELLDNMAQLFGSLRGGLAYSVCIVGALLAASTGIVGATVVTMGLLSLPTMLRRGYSAPFACGSIAAAGTLGQIIPPSIVLVLLADQLAVAYQTAQLQQGIFAPDTVSVNDLFAGSLFPGLMLVGLYIIYQIAIAWWSPQTAPAIPLEQLERSQDKLFIAKILYSLIAPVMLIISVLGSILAGLASPTEAASVGAVGAILLAGYRLDQSHNWLIIIGAISLISVLVLTIYVDLRIQRDNISTGEWHAIYLALVLTFGVALGIFVALLQIFRHRTDTGSRILVDVMRSTLEISSMVFIILVGATLFSLVFRGFGGDEMIAEFLHSLPGGTIMALIVVISAMFILGFFLDFLEIVVIIVPIVAPILLQMEIIEGELMNPIWLGVMFAIVLQTSFLTPPFGFALFYLRGVAPSSVDTLAIYVGVIPFVMMQLLALLILWYLPSLATWLPALLYRS